MRSFPVGGLVGWLGYTKLSDSQYGLSHGPACSSQGGDGGWREGGKGRHAIGIWAHLLNLNFFPWLGSSVRLSLRSAFLEFGPIAGRTVRKLNTSTPPKGDRWAFGENGVVVGFGTPASPSPPRGGGGVLLVFPFRPVSSFE